MGEGVISMGGGEGGSIRRNDQFSRVAKIFAPKKSARAIIYLAMIETPDAVKAICNRHGERQFGDCLCERVTALLDRHTAVLRKERDHLDVMEVQYHDTIHRLEIELELLRAKAGRKDEALAEVVNEEKARMRGDGIPESSIGTPSGFTSRILSIAFKALSPAKTDGDKPACPNCKHPKHGPLCWAVKNDNGVATCPCGGQLKYS